MSKFVSIALALACASAAVPAAAVGLLGQSFDYCTNSIYAGTVTSNPAACTTAAVFAQGTATVIDPGVEVNLIGTGTRTVDFTNAQIRVTYSGVGSPSPDLFVFTGFKGLTNLTLATGDPLNITTVFNSTSIGLLINSPLNNGVVVFDVASTGGAVPEPASWAMMMFGFGAVGSVLRISKRARKAAAI